MVKKKKEYMVSVGAKVPPAVREDAEQIAQRRLWTLSKYVCEALKAAVQRDKNSAVGKS